MRGVLTLFVQPNRFKRRQAPPKFRERVNVSMRNQPLIQKMKNSVTEFSVTLFKEIAQQNTHQFEHIAHSVFGWAYRWPSEFSREGHGFYDSGLMGTVGTGIGESNAYRALLKKSYRILVSYGSSPAPRLYQRGTRVWHDGSANP